MIICDICGFEVGGVLCTHKRLIKPLPWLCIECNTKIYTITWVEEFNRFKFECPECGEVYYT